MNLWNQLEQLKKMTWIDLSHEFGENTPRWPGFEPLKKEIKLHSQTAPQMQVLILLRLM